MANYKLLLEQSSKKPVWKTVNRVHHSPAEIKYVSENEMPIRKKDYIECSVLKAPWRPASRSIKHKSANIEILDGQFSPRAIFIEPRSSSGKPKTSSTPEKIWKPTNPNSRRPYNETKLLSENLVDILKADQEKHRKNKLSVKMKMPLFGPWIPADSRNKQGVNWGTINPFPAYDPFYEK